MPAVTRDAHIEAHACEKRRFRPLRAIRRGRITWSGVALLGLPPGPGLAKSGSGRDKRVIDARGRRMARP